MASQITRMYARKCDPTLYVHLLGVLQVYGPAGGRVEHPELLLLCYIGMELGSVRPSDDVAGVVPPLLPLHVRLAVPPPVPWLAQ